MVLSKVAVRRLTILANFMEKLPKEANKHFDMRSYFRHDGDHVIPDRNLITKDLFDCHTSACALGWAATIPSFKRAGLYLHPDDEVRFKESDNTWAAAAFFEINIDQATHLFGGHTVIRTPKQWARRCRKFIEDPGVWWSY